MQFRASLLETLFGEGSTRVMGPATARICESKASFRSKHAGRPYLGLRSGEHVVFLVV